MSMFKNLFGSDKPDIKQKEGNENTSKPTQTQLAVEQAQQAAEEARVAAEQARQAAAQATAQVAQFGGHGPTAPSIDTNPDPSELVLEKSSPEDYWDEDGNPVFYEAESDANGYYDESGNYIYYGSENDPNGYYDESGNYIYYGSEDDLLGYYDEGGNYIYYGSEDDPNGYYDEHGNYIYYSQEEAAETVADGYWDEDDNYVYYGSENDTLGYYNEKGEYVYYNEPVIEEPEQAAPPPEQGTLEPQKEKSYSIIADETVVTGNIQTSGHIDIVGEVVGNVDAGGNIAVLGSVAGNVSSEKMGLDNCHINGNLKASVGIVASETSTVIGNVRTKNLLLDGKLKGNINVDNVVVLRKNAYFLGDVQAGQIAIEMGAIFNGNIKMLTQGDPNEPFYEAL